MTLDTAPSGREPLDGRRGSGRSERAVPEDDAAGTERRRLDEVHALPGRCGGEVRRAAAQDHRHEHESILVNEVVTGEARDQRALPKISTLPSPACLSRATSAAASLDTSVVLLQSARFRVR